MSGNTVGYPVQRPLRNVVVKEWEYGNQLVAGGEVSEAEKDVGSVEEDGAFGVTVLDKSWDTLVVVEVGRKHVP